MESLINSFIEEIKKGKIPIYNEFGIQFELAIFLRKNKNLNNFKIELERPIDYFGITKSKDCPKKEMDLVVYNDTSGEKHAIEIKFSKNGQVPVQMFKFCEDICFLEHLGRNGFSSCYSLVIVDRDDFYKKKKKTEGLYSFFRNNQPIEGEIQCSTGPQKDKVLKIEKTYKPLWKELIDGNFYYLLRV